MLTYTIAVEDSEAHRRSRSRAYAMRTWSATIVAQSKLASSYSWHPPSIGPTPPSATNSPGSIAAGELLGEVDLPGVCTT